jgi:hypothetical protein
MSRVPGGITLLRELNRESSPKKVTRYHHRFYPLERKVRADGHVLFYGKLYSTGDSHLGRKVYISYFEDTVTIKDLSGQVVSLHESIQNTKRRVSTFPEHFGPWKRALDYNSYYRETARNFGIEVEGFVLSILNKKRGLIDSSSIHRLFKLAKKHTRDIFLGLCSEQVSKGEYRLKPLVAMLEWLDG